MQGQVELMVFTSRDLNLRWVAFVTLGRGSEHCEEEEIGQQGSGDEQVRTSVYPSITLIVVLVPLSASAIQRHLPSQVSFINVPQVMMIMAAS